MSKHQFVEQTDNIELEDLGILKMTKAPPTMKNLSQDEKYLLVQLSMYGEEGMPMKLVKKFDKIDPSPVLTLEFSGYCEWIKDKLGRVVALALTWKGDETAAILKKVALRENRNEVWSPDLKPNQTKV